MPVPFSPMVDQQPFLEKIRNRSSCCVVAGLGIVGKTQCRLLLDQNFPVIGYDIDPKAVESSKQELGYPDNKNLLTLSDCDSCLESADIVFVCVRTSLHPNGKPNRDALQSLIKSIRSRCSSPTFVVIVSTVVVGTSQWFADQLATAAPNRQHFLVGYSPERIFEGQSLEDIRETPRLVSGVGLEAAELTSELISLLCKQSVAVSRPEAAEMGKLLENTFRTNCIALVGEITRASNALGIEATEVCRAAASKPFGYFPFFPGPGVGGHCLPNDLRLLEASFSTAGVHSPVLSAVREAISLIPDAVVKRLDNMLENLRRADILMVGVGFKPGSSDTSFSPAKPLAEKLLSRAASVSYFDSKVHEFSVSGTTVPRVENLEERKWDAVLILSGDSNTSLSQLYAVSKVVLDTGGSAVMKGDDSGLFRL